MSETNELLPADVITFTYETTVDYVVDVKTGEVKVENNGELAEEPHYAALFREGEFVAEYQLDGHTLAEGDDAKLLDRAATFVDIAMDRSTVVQPELNQHLLARLEILQAALRGLANPDFRVKPTGQDARDMAAFAQRELDKAEGA